MPRESHPVRHVAIEEKGVCVSGGAVNEGTVGIAGGWGCCNSVDLLLGRELLGNFQSWRLDTGSLQAAVVKGEPSRAPQVSSEPVRVGRGGGIPGRQEVR